MKKEFLITLLSISIFPFMAFCQAGTSVVNTTVFKLKSYLTVHVPEKAYLQFDKPLYAAGDTIYFKAYVTMGERHRPSNISGVLRVDLINTKNKIDQSIKLQLDNGVAWGDFALPDSLPGGNYRIRAYTQWMRNNGDMGFFEKTIPVGSINNTGVPESMVKQPVKAANSKPEIQFFPEGGSLVSGIRCKIAFKAIGTDGLGINVKGLVVNQDNKEVCTFEAARLGMGCFYLAPKDGETYTAKLTYTNGIQDDIALPKPEASGIAMSVDNDSIPKALVKIEANAAYFQANRGKGYTLLIYSGGNVTTVTCKLDSPVINLTVLKRKLHTGIATVTLFSASGEPLCERLLFIQNYDRLSFNLSSDKPAYAPRERVSIKLNVKNRADSAVAGHFSVSVTDEDKVPADENKESTILTSLLLTSDLKGYVEQPNYYFTDTSARAAKNLDLLMLTQGYRRFEWKKILTDGYSPITYQPEKALEISGRVTNLLGKPIDGGAVTLIPSTGGGILSSKSDKKGIFHFNNLVFVDTTNFLLSAVNAAGKNATKITYFPELSEVTAEQKDIKQNVSILGDTAMEAFLKNEAICRNEAVNYSRSKGIMLKEVKIRDKKPDDNYHTESLAGAGHADQVMHADELQQIPGPLVTSLNGRLRGVSFFGTSIFKKIPVLTINSMSGIGKNVPSPMLVVVDGAELPYDVLANLNSNDVETVEVLKYSSASIYGMNGGNGVLIITTKRGGGANVKDIASIGILPIAPVGFYKAREFYSPKYDLTNLNNKQKDFRSTIYWSPEIKTDKNGNASFEFYNADGAGTYKVVVEGIDENGNLGRQVYRYKVE